MEPCCWSGWDGQTGTYVHTCTHVCNEISLESRPNLFPLSHNLSLTFPPSPLLSLLTSSSPSHPQVKLQPSPNFVIVPHSPYPVSGRRMKSWQHQLGNIGKVYQVVLPSHVTEAGHTTSAEACARYIIIGTCSKVQEVSYTIIS